MKLAVLFWCYKELDLCEDRLRHLRSHDPDTPIYVLFGGEPEDAPPFERRLGPYVNDFWVFDEPKPYLPDCLPGAFRGGQFWKYMYGDLLIAAWHRRRGVDLEWDTVVIVQWDMLLYGRIPELFSCLKKDQILLSGLRPVAEVADEWVWVAPQFEIDHTRYHRYLDHMRERYGYRGEPKCYVAIVSCLPRVFLDRFAEIERPELGFLEYRIPIYAEAFGVPFCTDHPFQAWWGTQPYSVWSTLRARPREIWAPTIFANVRRRDGARVFHPYWRRTPRGLFGWAWALLDSVPRVLIDTWRAWREKQAAQRQLAAEVKAEPLRS
ncbi:MAG: hypothetical protein AAF628_21595 [Planctomycetota bacterium]